MAEKTNSMKVTIDSQNAVTIGTQALKHQLSKKHPPSTKEPKK